MQTMTEVARTSFTHEMSQDPTTISSLGTRWFQEKARTPTSNWRVVINKDLKKIGIGWDEVQEAAEDSWCTMMQMRYVLAGWSNLSPPTGTKFLTQIKTAAKYTAM